MSTGKPVLRAEPAAVTTGVPGCDGCALYSSIWDWDCSNLRPASCCNYNGNSEFVIFKEVRREPVRNST